MGIGTRREGDRFRLVASSGAYHLDIEPAAPCVEQLDRWRARDLAGIGPDIVDLEPEGAAAIAHVLTDPVDLQMKTGTGIGPGGR